MTIELSKKKPQISIALWILCIIFAVCILIFLIWNLVHRGLFEYIGIDYRLWYSSAMIARYHGFDLIYDINLQTHYQIRMYQQYARITTVSIPFWPLPLPYLSVFIFPMLLLTLIEPVTGFFLWSFINTVGTLVYLTYFIRQNKLWISWKFIFVTLFALPLFLNITFGNVNIWLLIAFGESITALKKGCLFRSGFWIAGLLLKPQTLLILIPGLIFARQFKLLAGALAGAIIIAISSFLLSGTNAFLGPFETIMNWPKILADTGMTIFSLSTNLNQFLPNIISNIISISLILITFFSTMWLWFPNQQPLSGDNLELSFLASFAAACAISPHSNVHMALPLLAPGLALVSKKRIPIHLVLGWVFIPMEIFLIVSISSIGAAHIFGGMGMLIANLFILYWIIVNNGTKVSFLGRTSDDTGRIKNKANQK
jgi:hypothetical protein